MQKNDKFILKVKKRQLNTSVKQKPKLEIFAEQKKNLQNNRPKSKNILKIQEKKNKTQNDFYLKKNNNNNLKPIKLFNNNINNNYFNLNKKNIHINKEKFSEEKNNNKKRIFISNNFDDRNKVENNIININNILSQSPKKKNSNLLQKNYIIINKLNQENNSKKNINKFQNKINIIKIEENKNKNLNDIFPKIKKMPKVKEHMINIEGGNNLNKISNKRHDIFDINNQINLKNNIPKKKIKVVLSKEINANKNKKIFNEIININNNKNPNFNKNIRYVLKNLPPPIQKEENNHLINKKNLFNNKENKLIFKLNINNININYQMKNEKSSDKFILKNNNNIFPHRNNIQKNEFNKLKLRINSFNEDKENKLIKQISEKEKDLKENLIPLKDYFYREEINSRTHESMEDFTLIKHPFLSLDKHNLSLFCVFDGHGGDFVAKYLKENFASILHNSIKINYTLNFHGILKSTFESADKKLEKYDITQNCGSTGTIVVLDNNIIYCANVGDSKCFYIDKNNAVQISEDHNCKNEKEKEILKKKGVKIFLNRVFGSLSLTRTFGDFEFKKEGITSIPYIKKIYLDKNDIKYNKICYFINIIV